MERAGKLLHAEEAFAAGYTGKGVTVAVIDTGIGVTPQLSADRIVTFRDFVKLQHSPYDDAGHGTHVAGILAGDNRLGCGSFRGIAPECKLVVLKALNEKGDGELAGVIAALEWILEQKEQYDIRVLNLSFGAFEQETKLDYSKLLDLVEKLWENGICVVTAAGNRGPEGGTITVPGSNRVVITVGAAEGDKGVYLYSGRGPTKENVWKPDLVTPAVGVVSLRPMGKEPRRRLCFLLGGKRQEKADLLSLEEWKMLFAKDSNYRRKCSRFYAVKSGTSMAAPMVAGAVCLLLQKEPELSPDEIKKRLCQACQDMGVPREQQGYGMLDLRKLLELQTEIK